MDDSMENVSLSHLFQRQMNCLEKNTWGEEENIQCAGAQKHSQVIFTDAISDDPVL